MNKKVEGAGRDRCGGRAGKQLTRKTRRNSKLATRANAAHQGCQIFLDTLYQNGKNVSK
jgi:hypothetical protein